MVPTSHRPDPSQAPARPRGGFTLIELLVVLAVTSLLMALLMPTLAEAQRSARQVKCASNQRQVGMMLTSYAEAYNRYPLDYFNSATDQTVWYAAAAKHSGLEYSLVSGTSHPGSVPAHVRPYFRCPEEPNVYYSMNSHFTRGLGAGISSPTDRRLRNPLNFNRNDMVLLVEGFNRVANVRATATTTACNPQTSNQPLVELTRHGGIWTGSGLDSMGRGSATNGISGGLINVLFVDGHVNDHRALTAPLRGGINSAAGADDRLWDMRQN